MHFTSALRQVVSTAHAYVSSNTLKSPQDIQKLLSAVTWSLQELRASHSLAGRAPITITPEYLNKLLKMSGLETPQTDQERDSLITYLQNQGRMVDHVHDIDTEGLGPLRRIAPRAPRKITLDQIKNPELYSGPNVTGWDPLSLPKVKEARFFVLNEGLKKSGI